MNKWTANIEVVPAPAKAPVPTEGGEFAEVAEQLPTTIVNVVVEAAGFDDALGRARIFAAGVRIHSDVASAEIVGLARVD